MLDAESTTEQNRFATTAKQPAIPALSATVFICPMKLVHF